VKDYRKYCIQFIYNKDDSNILSNNNINASIWWRKNQYNFMTASKRRATQQMPSQHAFARNCDHLNKVSIEQL